MDHGQSFPFGSDFNDEAFATAQRGWVALYRSKGSTNTTESCFVIRISSDQNESWGKGKRLNNIGLR
jgi:hypothetical protein